MKRKSMILLVLITIVLISLFAFPASIYAKVNGHYVYVFYSIVSSPFNEPVDIPTSYGTYDEALAAAKEMAESAMNKSDKQEEMAKLDDGEFLNYIYDALFHRLPDEEGYASWLNGLEGGLSRSEVIESFISSDEFALRYVYKSVPPRVFN